MLDALRAVLTRPGYTDAELRALRGVISSLDYYSPSTPAWGRVSRTQGEGGSEAGSGRTAEETDG